MNAITKITAKLNAEAQAIIATGKTPWVLATDTEVTFVAINREAARSAKAAGGEGKVVKFTDLTIEVIAPVVSKAQADSAEVLHESSIERPTKAVWHIADEMKGAKRRAVIAECVSRGIAYYTARTQYQQWFAIQKEMADRVAAQAKKK